MRPAELQSTAHPVLRLRPHHGMCILNFRGHGYSDAFSVHMAETVAQLKAHPETEIEITDVCDDLCSVCPHREGSACTSPRPPLFDQNVLRRTGLAAGQRVTWEEFSSRTNEYTLYHLDEMCPECNWLELCKEIARGRIITDPE